MFERSMRPSGTVAIRRIRRRGPGLAWTLRNRLRWAFVRGWVAKHWIMPVARWWGLMSGIGELELVLTRANGERIYYGVVAYRVITNAGVTFLRDDFNNGAQDISTMNFHGVGTGATAEAAGDTALVTESTTALNPDNTRATGTRSTPASNQFATVGTLTFDASAAITEHGLFNQAATGGGTLWDRSVFSVINVASGDSLQSTYTLTLSAGG